jgi:hypothetical protein
VEAMEFPDHHYFQPQVVFFFYKKDFCYSRDISEVDIFL